MRYTVSVRDQEELDLQLKSGGVVGACLCCFGAVEFLRE